MDWNQVRGSLRGPAALISSVFDDNFRLRPQAIENNVRWMVDNGFGNSGAGFYLAPCADGEYATLTTDEVATIVSAVRSGDGTDRAIVAGIHSNDLRQAIEQGQAARDAGAVAVMLAPPSYYQLNVEAILDWYHRFAEAVDIGIMLYDQAYRGPAVNSVLHPNTIAELVKIPSVVSIKHISLMGLIHSFEILDRFGDRIAYIDTSAGHTTTTAHMHGAAGWVTEVSPFWPEFDDRYWALLESRDYEAAENARGNMALLYRFLEDHPTSTSPYSWVNVVKCSLEYAGLEGGHVRPPFRELTDAEKKPLFDILSEIGAPRGRS